MHEKTSSRRVRVTKSPNAWELACLVWSGPLSKLMNTIGFEAAEFLEAIIAIVQLRTRGGGQSFHAGEVKPAGSSTLLM